MQATVERQAMRARREGRWGLFLLLIPALALFLIFFVVPVGTLLTISLNPKTLANLRPQADFTLEHFARFIGGTLYRKAVVQSLLVSLSTTVVSLVAGYPLAYIIAKTRRPWLNSLFMVLVLVPLQIDQVIRAYGLLALLGDNGMINQSLLERGIIDRPLPLMYNTFGVVVALSQVTIPFMVLSLVGAIRKIDITLEQAARNLGATWWKAFTGVTLRLSVPGILAGSLLVFALSISNFVAPVLLGGWRVVVLPMLVYKLISEVNNWQFAAAVSVVLLFISMVIVFTYNRVVERLFGWRV